MTDPTPDREIVKAFLNRMPPDATAAEILTVIDEEAENQSALRTAFLEWFRETT